jgi:hypothetical protein
LADGRRSERGFVTEHSDLSVPYLDLGDHRPQVCLARLNIGGVELLAHELREGFQPSGRDGRPGAGLNGHSVESGLRHYPLLLQRLDPLLEVGVEFNDALFDRPVEALEPVGTAGDLCLQGLSAPLQGLILGALTFDQGIQNDGKPIAAKQALFHIVDDQRVEPGHGHVSSAAHRLPLLLAAAAAVVAVDLAASTRMGGG